MERREFFCRPDGETLQRMGEQKNKVEQSAVHDGGVVAQTQQNIALHQRRDSACAAAAWTGEAGQSMKQTGRQKPGGNKVSHMIEEDQKSDDRQKKQAAKVEALLRGAGVLLHGGRLLSVFLSLPLKIIKNVIVFSYHM